ncbi:FadR family transcriptional regulator [Ancylobacter sp. 6x-1]|uniref:FadR family transcriptional regulator n=1 Tax=Ancylobacter crimeensis TaxID=2579147 RepID=A0ABT0DAJ1_9HYPH|nr:FadR/GntR family transcriptional regulator [Ancylobacter crimeensis]MCK0196975.1 FadR family transcriptional regulator [Ancylobacter crimeensis]
MSVNRTPERRLYQQVADQIRRLIQSGHFTLGARLPAERELAQQLGVSRPSLREALIALEIDGTVEIRMGSGIYVASNGEQKPSPPAATGESPVELMDARATLEAAILGLAAGRFTQEALDELRQSIEGMRAAIEEGRKPIEHDRQFHLLIAGQTGNGVMARVVAELFDERHSPISSQLRAHFDTTDNWRCALAEHEAILAALEMRDTPAAQMRMHRHLEESRRRWIESEPR